MKKLLSLKWLSGDNAVIGIFALIKLVLNIAFSSSYGYFRDELYYIACSDHLDWGYVDQPPLSIAILKISRLLFGDSLTAIRFTAVLAGVVVVIIAGLIARKLGGGRFAQGLASASIVFSPIILGNAGRYFSMNAFDLMFWAIASYIIVIIIKDGKPILWPLFGFVAGLGLMNKYSMLFFGAGLVIGLILTSQRKQFINKWFWIAAVIVLLIIMPHIIWEVQHGFPTREFIHNASVEKNAEMTFSTFLLGQFGNIGYGQAILFLIGLFYFFLNKDGKKLILFGWMYPIVFLIMLAGNAKVYYLTPIYGVYIAAGSVFIESLIQKPRRKWLKPVTAIVLLIPSLFIMPFAIPMLPVDKYIKYSQFLGMTPKAEERTQLGELPQCYADMFGWEEFVGKIARIYNTLTPAEKNKCIIWVRNYGEAGAVDFFGKKYGLPKAYCAHNSYWYWADLGKKFDILIILGANRRLDDNMADLTRPNRFEKVELADVTKCRYCMPYENGRQLFLCRGAKFTLKQIWAEERFFI